MKVKMLSEQEVFCEATEILLKNMSYAKMARFFAILHKKESIDYLTIREKLFEGETVETLYNQIQDFQSR